MATEEDVSHVIFEAATDEMDQLRYVATEGHQSFAHGEKRNIGRGIWQTAVSLENKRNMCCAHAACPSTQFYVGCGLTSCKVVNLRG